ncbi:MAG: thioredoxin family protein [Trebonia sp.]
MRLQILHVPDCPGARLLRARLADMVAAGPGIQVMWQVVATENTAARLGMTGSPTILADGRDLFAGPGLVPSLSCRLYPDENGRPGPAPTAGQLRRALRLAGG